MITFIIAFVVLLLVVGGMAIGLLQNKELQGSCGGIGALEGIERVCDCENPCEKRKARERKALELTQKF